MKRQLLSLVTIVAFLFVAVELASRGNLAASASPEARHVCSPTQLSPTPFASMDNGRNDGTDAVLWRFDWKPCKDASEYQLRVFRLGAALEVDVTLDETEYEELFLGAVIPASQRAGWVWAVRANVEGQWGAWNWRVFEVEPPDSDAPFTDARRLRVVAHVNTTLHPDATFAVRHPGSEDEIVLPVAFPQLASASESFLLPNGVVDPGVVEERTPPFWRFEGVALVTDPAAAGQCPVVFPPNPVIELPADSENYLACAYYSFTGRLIRAQKVTDAVAHPAGTFGFAAVRTLNLPEDATAGPAATYAYSTSLPFTIFESPPPVGWTGGGYAWLNDSDGSAQCSPEMAFTGANWPWVEVPPGDQPILACLMNHFVGTRTIRVQKVTGAEIHPAATFKGASYPGGPFTLSIAEDAPTGPAFELTIGKNAATLFENAGDGNWWPDVAGVLPDPTGTATCESGFEPNGGNVPPGSESFLVCFRNVYFPDTGSRQLRVIKVPDSEQHPGGVFGVSVSGTEPFNIGLAPNATAGHVRTVSMPTTGATVTEDALPEGWERIGYAVLADPYGTATCPTWITYHLSADIPPGSVPHLVCIKNRYNLPMRALQIQKITESPFHPAATFTGWISNGLGTFSLTLDANAPASAATTRWIRPNESIGVAENSSALPPGWTLDGYAFVPLTPGASCSPELEYGYPNTVPPSADSYLVCIKNSYAAPQLTVDLTLQLNSWEEDTGPDFQSNYTFTIVNNSAFDIDLSHLTLQSWYSLDGVLGGGDECGAAGRRLSAGLLPASQSFTDTFVANLEPSPYWPQCADRLEGYVIVDVHTDPGGPYDVGRWMAAYHVTRPPQPEDTDPPELLAFNISPQEVDVSIVSREVSITGRIVDSPAGAGGWSMSQSPSSATFASPSGKQSAVVFFDPTMVSSGTPQDGTYVRSFTLAAYSEPGVWTLTSVYLIDARGNQTGLLPEDMAALGFPTSFTVVSATPDLAPPQLLAFSFEPAAVSSPTGGQSVMFSARISDDLSGVHSGVGAVSQASFRSPSGSDWIYLFFDSQQQLVSGSPLDGEYEYIASLADGLEPGAWILEGIYLTDQVGNHQYLTTEQVAAAGFATELTILP